MIDLSDIEKGNLKLPLDDKQMLIEILRLSVSNQAMINALTRALLDESTVFANSDKEKILALLKEEHDSIYNERWAAFVNAVVKK